MLDFLSLFISKWDGPASEFIETFHRVNQVSVEGVPAHLAIGQNFNAGPELQVDCLIDGAILDALKFRVRHFPGGKLRACVFQVSRAQQAAHNVASKHSRLLATSIETTQNRKRGD
jgi:hypothetical protein